MGVYNCFYTPMFRPLTSGCERLDHPGAPSLLCLLASSLMVCFVKTAVYMLLIFADTTQRMSKWILNNKKCSPEWEALFYYLGNDYFTGVTWLTESQALTAVLTTKYGLPPPIPPPVPTTINSIV